MLKRGFISREPTFIIFPLSLKVLSRINCGNIALPLVGKVYQLTQSFFLRSTSRDTNKIIDISDSVQVNNFVCMFLLEFIVYVFFSVPSGWNLEDLFSLTIDSSKFFVDYNTSSSNASPNNTLSPAEWIHGNKPYKL